MENLPNRQFPNIECKSFQLITNPVINYVLKSDASGIGAWSTGGGGGSGTITSITAGTGLAGGTITTSGTIDLANTAVTPATYTNANITVDAHGRITSAANGTINPGTITSITAGTGLAGGTITTSGTIDLANTAVTPAAYTNANITVNAQGRITAAANGSAGVPADLFNAFVPSVTYPDLKTAIDAGKNRICINDNCNSGGILNITATTYIYCAKCYININSKPSII